MGQSVINNPTEKKCMNFCPNCNAGQDDIDWGSKEWMDDACAWDAQCNKCGCYFKEYYVYAGTEFEIGSVPRVPCSYPMNNFYTYMDEIPDEERVSTPEDCEKCDEEECDVRHCLIGAEGKYDPVLAMMVSAMEIISDFDTYGEVLQQGEDGEYGPDSSIERLRKAVKDYRASL